MGRFLVIQRKLYGGVRGLGNELHNGQDGLGEVDVQSQPRMKYESKEKGRWTKSQLNTYSTTI